MTAPGQGLEAALDRYRSLRGASVTAGIQQAQAREDKDVRGPRRTVETDPDTTLLEVAERNHYGLGVPPRPWLATALDRYRRRWSRLAANVVRKPGEQAQRLRILGVQMVADCKAALLDGPWQPNSQRTVERKGSDQPLVDTGQLLNSHRAEVTLGDGSKHLVE